MKLESKEKCVDMKSNAIESSHWKCKMPLTSVTSSKPIHKAVTAAVLASVLALSNVCNAKAANWAIEVMNSSESTVVDTNVTGRLTSHAGIFARNITTTWKDNRVSAFSLVDLSYGISKNVNAVVETQFIDKLGISPRPGLQLNANVKDSLSIFLMATAGLKLKDAELVVLLQHRLSIAKGISWVNQVEAVTNVGPSDYNFSVQKLRSGLQKDKFTVGVATDLSETNSSTEIKHSVGLFCSIRF